MVWGWSKDRQVNGCISLFGIYWLPAKCMEPGQVWGYGDTGCSPTQRLAYWQLAALHSGNSLWELSSNVERYLTQGSSLSPKVAQIQEECNCWPLVSIQNKSERPPQLQSSSWVRRGLYCNH